MTDFGPTPKFPNVHVKLTGTDGNIFALAGRVDRAMRAAHLPNSAIQEMLDMVWDSASYNEALQVLMKTVDVS